jgi:hypothetical protein
MSNFLKTSCETEVQLAFPGSSDELSPGASAAGATSVLTAPDTCSTAVECSANPAAGLTTRISKIKVALVIGYNGSRFNGLQRNPGQFTIEDVIEDAVCVPDESLLQCIFFSDSFVPGSKSAVFQSATIAISTKSAGLGPQGQTKGCMRREMLFPLRCLRLASSLKTVRR